MGNMGMWYIFVTTKLLCVKIEIVTFKVIDIRAIKRALM